MITRVFSSIQQAFRFVPASQPVSQAAIGGFTAVLWRRAIGRPWHFARLTLMSLLLALSCGNGFAQTPDKKAPIIKPQESLLSVAGGTDSGKKAAQAQKNARALKYPLLSGKLENKLFDAWEKVASDGTEAAVQMLKARNVTLAENGQDVVVIVSLAPDIKLMDVETQLKSRGTPILRSGPDTVKIAVPIADLDDIALMPGVLSVRAVNPPRPKNAIQSQGISATVANAWHTAGFTGQNVKLAIVDMGFANLVTLKAQDEIPAAAIEVNYTASAMNAGSGSHGSACAETVYDMAPGVSMYLIKIDDPTDLIAVKDYCIAQGIKIVSFSIGWDALNFHDGVAYANWYSTVANHPVTAVDLAQASGIFWCTAAGNEQKQQSLIDWRDGGTTPDGALDWNSTNGNLNILWLNGSSTIPAGNWISIYMTWNQWPTTNQDFDLDLYCKPTGSTTWTRVASGSDTQSGTSTSYPYEDISYQTTQGGQYAVLVASYGTNTSPTFILRYYGVDEPNYFGYGNLSTPVPGSISIPGDAASAFTVGAINYANYPTGPIEYFSSLGPNNRAYTGGSAVIKPDICGPDMTASVTYGTSFGGTSAATPHISGLAALVKGAYPSYTLAQIKTFIESNGFDLGIAGKDNTFGSGAARLPSPPALPTVQWTSASQSGAENVGTMTVTAQLSAASGLPVTVPFTVSGSAANPADYTITTSPITIAAGATTGSATITVVNDTLYENNETVIVTMGTPTNATVGTTTVHTAIINIDATDIPSVQWTSASQSGAESVGTMTVTAQLSAVSELPVTVPFTVTGTATNPADYTITTSPITIAAGSTTGSATITVVNDTLYENNETVALTIGAPTNATLGATTVHTATINIDATDIPSVQWTSASQSGAESVGTMTVTAQLSAVSALPTTVPFTVTGTATNPADYTITASPITIAAGSTTGSATIIVVNDTLYENNETVIVTMGAPTNATLGATTVHTATINDDDNSPIQIWRQTYFGSIANSGEGADLNDFDKDGLVNLIEFGFGLNPKTNSSGLLPRPQRSGNNFVVSFTQPADVSGITYGAEWSQSLLAGNWNGVADTGVFPQHTFSVPIGTMTKLFMRLRVTNP